MIHTLQERILEAETHRAPDVLTTPLTRSHALSRLLDCDLFMKCEHLQTTGSFKYRGASNKMRVLVGDSLRSGVIAASSGNHGQAVALAARNAGLSARIYVSATASPAKRAAIQAYGAELVILDKSFLGVEEEARRVAERENLPYISPYNDLDVVAGQGLIGRELLQQSSGFDAVFVSVGGGGLISGIGAAVKAELPETRIIGCWPRNAPALHHALDHGAIIEVPEEETLSDGTAGGIESGSVTFDLCRKLIDGKILVSEDSIASSMRDIAAHEHWITEGAAGVALAGLTALRDEFRGQRVVVILCGRNIVFDVFMDAMKRADRSR